MLAHPQSYWRWAWNQGAGDGANGQEPGEGKNQLGGERTGAEVSLASEGAPLEAGSGMVWEGSCQAKDGIKLKRTLSAGDSVLPHVDRQEPGQKAELWAE